MQSLSTIDSVKWLHVVKIRLDEELQDQGPVLPWGSRTTDEIHLALLWIDQKNEVAQPRSVEAQLSQDFVLISSDNDSRTLTLLDAARVWLEEADASLLIVPSLKPSAVALDQALRQQGRIVLPRPLSLDSRMPAKNESIRRLAESGRLVSWSGSWRPSDYGLEAAIKSGVGKRFISVDLSDESESSTRPPDVPVIDNSNLSVLYPASLAVVPVPLARLLLGGNFDLAVSLLRSSAESGDLRRDCRSCGGSSAPES